MEKTPMKVALETAADLGFEKTTMRQIEQLAVPRVKQLTPKQIKGIRSKAKFSQGVMALCLNVKPSNYQKWERGETIPKGTALKLLNLAYRDGLGTII